MCEGRLLNELIKLKGVVAKIFSVFYIWNGIPTKSQHLHLNLVQAGNGFSNLNLVKQIAGKRRIAGIAASHFDVKRTVVSFDIKFIIAGSYTIKRGAKFLHIFRAEYCYHYPLLV